MNMFLKILKFILCCLSKCLSSACSTVSDAIFSFLYEGARKELPPITNRILLESVAGLAEKIRTKQVSSVEVVEAFISRINEVNPILNCVVQQRFKEALQEASNVDKYLRSTELSHTDICEPKPLLGVPFTIKDSFYVEGLKNTCGLYFWRNDISDKDSDVVMLLKEAGAIPLALTNVPELCEWYECYNTIYGRTNNPYHTGCIPGGSSGGEGALQASGGSPFGIGSDIAGSIRMPAFFNGIFGHKPSPGIVSNNGQRPERSEKLESLNTVGPLCRYSSDLTIIFDIISAKGKHKLNLDSKVNISCLRYYGMIEVTDTTSSSPVNIEVKRCFQNVVHYLQTKDIKVQKVYFQDLSLGVAFYDNCTNRDDIVPFSQEVTGRQGDLNVWLESLYWILGKSKHTYPAIRYAIRKKLSPKLGSEEQHRLTYIQEGLLAKFQNMLGDDGVFLFPSHPRPAPYHYQPNALPVNIAYTAVFNVLGLPSTHCPIQLTTQGLPIGIQVVAGRNQDHLCLAVAKELETAFGGWKPPCRLQL